MPDELTDIEARLLGMRPDLGTLDRDRMLFEAGRAQARSRARDRAWAGALAASLAVAAGLGVGLARERSQRLGLERRLAVRERPPEPTRPAASPPFEVAPDSYLALTHRALAGLDDPPRPGLGVGRALTPATDPAPSPLRSRGPTGLQDL